MESVAQENNPSTQGEEQYNPGLNIQRDEAETKEYRGTHVGVQT